MGEPKMEWNIMAIPTVQSCTDNCSFAIDIKLPPRAQRSTLASTQRCPKSKQMEILDTKFFTATTEREKLEYPPTISPKHPHFFARLLWQVKEKLKVRGPLPNCRIFFEEQGMIGYTPENTQVGDLICQFKRSRAVAVVRQNEDTHRHQLVGKAVTFNPSAMESFRCQALNTKVKCRDVSERPILFHLTIPTLQLLTAPELPLSTLVNLDMFF